MKTIFLLFIKFYQYIISPFLGRNCRFQPTCSEYAKQCFEKFPVHKALWYSTKRLLKCHPFHPGGYDPVSCDCSHSMEKI
ncbi:MAG: membrane protein insertion efficiency factor YidD [Deltaproteobacteria bacterium]|nr:MAG: membrane protein insertion efficiency factor YidD [Deltaproteobacteria bacterium]